jgi:hypothetical protein
MPMTRDLVVVGDFNTHMSRQDHANGASPNPGHQEWASVREAYKTHDVWRGWAATYTGDLAAVMAVAECGVGWRGRRGGDMDSG